jgi:hypothetical protein
MKYLKVVELVSSHDLEIPCADKVSDHGLSMRFSQYMHITLFTNCLGSCFITVSKINIVYYQINRNKHSNVLKG